MKETTVTWAGVIDTFLVLLVGIGPKLALVPYLKITAPFDAETQRRVRRKMLTVAAVTALLLVLLGELLRLLFHFSVGSLAIAGGIILLVLGIRMVFEQAGDSTWNTGDTDPLSLAAVPLAIPYLLNPVGIVGLITISSEVGSLVVLLVELAILGVVLSIDFVVFGWASRRPAGINEERMIIVEKVFGFLIAAIAVQLVLDGLHSTGVVAHLTH